MNYGAVITAVSAAIVLIGVVFNLLKNNSISEGSIDRTEQAESKLTAEHIARSSEHDSLSSEHKLLLERSADMKSSMSSMCGIIQEDRLQRTKDQAEQKIQYASLSDAQKHLDDHAREIGKFADEFRRLAAENTELKSEKQSLSRENQHLREQNKYLESRLNNFPHIEENEPEL